MKLYAVISPLCILFSQGIMPAQAQQLAGGKIQVDSVLARKNGNRMDVAFRMNLNDLKMKSEQQMVFTPVMVGTDSIALNPIIIQGRNQAVRYRRLADSKKNPQAQVLTRKNKTSQQVYFAQAVPYQKWMKKFKLSVKEDLCGCGNLIEQDNTQIADIDRTPKITKDFFVQPKAEAKKVRAEKGEAYLSFKLNKSNILANFRENATELKKITSTIDLVKNDKNVEITDIDIHGFASPDGSYANNKRLANERAAALRNYVSSLYTINSKLFTYQATPEDWEGFKKKIQASHLADKEAILEIANSSLAPDDKDLKIRKLHPASYRYILDHIYPRLRHSDYTVENSSHICGSKLMNGIGGSCDYERNGYISIFTTQSTTKNGCISAIVPMCSHVDSTEHDVDVIVTEQGVADLRGKGPLRRAKEIIENCAHPDYRPMLREYLKFAEKGQIGRASCREECRSRWSPYH